MTDLPAYATTVYRIMLQKIFAFQMQIDCQFFTVEKTFIQNFYALGFPNLTNRGIAQRRHNLCEAHLLALAMV